MSSEWVIFLNFLEACLECLYTKSKFWISCMCVSLLVSLLPYWNYVYIGISPILDDIYFWNFWRHSPDISELFPKYSVFLVSLVSLSQSLLYLFQFIISGGQLLRPLVLFYHMQISESSDTVSLESVQLKTRIKSLTHA